MIWTHRHIPRSMAQDFIRQHHRTHKPQVGEIVCLGAFAGNSLVGVAVIGRPVARMLDDGNTAEVTRLCVPENNPNLCSWLIARARRVIQALGFTRALSYTLPSEGGASWRAAGCLFDGTSGGGEWDTPARRRKAVENAEPKTRWMLIARESATEATA